MKWTVEDDFVSYIWNRQNVIMSAVFLDKLPKKTYNDKVKIGALCADKCVASPFVCGENLYRGYVYEKLFLQSAKMRYG